MKKTLVAFGAALTLALSLSACGAGGKSYQPDIRTGQRCPVSSQQHENWDGRMFYCRFGTWQPQYNDSYWSSYTHSNRYTPPTHYGYKQPKTVYTQPGVRKPITSKPQSKPASGSKPKSVYSKPASGGSYSKPKSVYSKSGGSSFGGKRK